MFADLDRQFPTWDYTKDQSNICEVHHCVMEIEFVRVFRGLPMAMPRSIDSTVIAIGRKYQNQGVEAAPQLFELPHARHDITGCITGEVKDAKIYVCKMCNGDHK
ncbi:MAG: hypothetical protein HY286_02340 [Planctomycetes bacterium]|nr:hypothetical protein [Planctomycetota bacterium]